MPNNNPFLQNPANNVQNEGGWMPLPSGGADNFEIDLTDVKDGFTVPDGLYKVKCVEITQSVSKGGNPMFEWTFEISEGDHAGFQSKVFTAITPAAMWKVAETVVALGVGQQGEVVKFKRSDVIGKECGAMFEESEYNGRSRSQISKVVSLSELALARNK